MIYNNEVIYDFEGLSTFNNCSFFDKEFDGYVFDKCIFNDCDLSNLVFIKCGFHNCCFNGCKLLGTSFTDCSFKNNNFCECNNNYMSFLRCKLLEVSFILCNGSFNFESVIFNNINFKNNKISVLSVIRSSFSNIDLCSNFIEKYRIDVVDLRGCKMDYDQCVIFMECNGIIV